MLGVSPDPVKAVKKFHGEPVAELHPAGRRGPRGLRPLRRLGREVDYGRTYWGALRATFVIDPDGKVAKVFPKVSPKTHDEVVLNALGELSAAA